MRLYHWARTTPRQNEGEKNGEDRFDAIPVRSERNRSYELAEVLL